MYDNQQEFFGSLKKFAMKKILRRCLNISFTFAVRLKFLASKFNCFSNLLQLSIRFCVLCNYPPIHALYKIKKTPAFSLHLWFFLNSSNSYFLSDPSWGGGWGGDHILESSDIVWSHYNLIKRIWTNFYKVLFSSLTALKLVSYFFCRTFSRATTACYSPSHGAGKTNIQVFRCPFDEWPNLFPATTAPTKLTLSAAVTAEHWPATAISLAYWCGY